MPKQPKRPRRTATHRQIALLRALGWRWSPTREAWVHRIGRGRVGPAFSRREPLPADAADLPDLRQCEAIFEAEAASALDAPDERVIDLVPEPVDEPLAPLPRRRPTASQVAGELAASRRFDAVRVDGRPPLRPTPTGRNEAVQASA